MEAFNLKGAIEYNMKNYEAAREAMADAPPRTEEELDPVRAASNCCPCYLLLAHTAMAVPALRLQYQGSMCDMILALPYQ